MTELYSHTCPENNGYTYNMDNDINLVVVMSTIYNKLVLEVEQIAED
jgi:hypothetical protein